MTRETIRSLVTRDHKYAALTKVSRGYEIAMDGRWVLLSAEVAQVLGLALVKAATPPARPLCGSLGDEM